MPEPAPLAQEFAVTFWGVRGSIASPGPETARYGGNTSCVEVRCGARRLVFDAGTGIRALGQALGAEAVRDVDLILSHWHYDHIVGLPFFAPLHREGWRVRIWSARSAEGGATRARLDAFMRPPFFPLTPAGFRAAVDFRDFGVGEVLDLGDGIRIATAALNHPNGCSGFRLEFGGRAFAYATDTEHVLGVPDRNVLELARDADLVVYDSTYTDAEFAEAVGFGHSTWQEGARLCEAAGAGICAAFHHRPSRSDDDLDRIAAEARHFRPRTIMAREGLSLPL